MSQIATQAPRLRLFRTTVVYVAVWPLIAGIAAMIGTFFSGSPFRPGEFLTNPRGMMGFFLLFYVVCAVPASFNGLIVALISPSSPRPWMLPAVSSLWGALLLGLTGFLTLKSLDLFFPILGLIAGGAAGLILVWRRPWFERPMEPAKERGPRP